MITLFVSAAHVHSRLKLFLFGCLLCVSTGLAGERIYSESTVSFEVAGFDRRSVQFVAELGQQIEVTAKGMLNDLPERYPNRILVALRSEPLVEGQPVALRYGERGVVRLDLHWDARMQLDQVSVALADAYLRRYVYFSQGPQAPLPPAWTKYALGMQCYLRLRPAMLVECQRQLRARSSTPIESILKIGEAESFEAGSASLALLYWRALKETVGDGRLLSRYYQAAVLNAIGVTGLQSLLNQLAPVETMLTPEAWWQSWLQAFLAEEYEMFESLEVSRNWIEQIADFSAFETDAGQRVTSLKDLWKLREDTGLRRVLEARLEILVLRLSKVNPAYYNAAHSLGLLLETVISAEQAPDFIRSLTTYLGDIEDTKRLQARVEMELSTSL